ncbi:CAF17-like 4Fe-4S cluster assembly/insertion protein YgfZ [Azospirillum sp. ST 5-10]|uniref:CAF17-like 4Fe-4S cluster assembly/insertion protein YgfZ n=1 Tax=unclassified Azospirillum TaxID=2630922 RepID=UPI003F49B6B3
MGEGTAGYTILEERGVLAVGGDDRVAFLQGLVSNDVRRAGPEQALYALFLTPQGKFLHDLFLIGGDALLLDVEAPRRDDLLRRLKIYKLRSKVALEDRSDRHAVAVAFGPGALARLGLPAEPGAARPFAGGVVYTDPRLPALGARAVLPGGDARAASEEALAAAGLEPAPYDAYDRLRLELGIPDGSRDLEVERAIPLENNLDALHAISWDKGCYMGQELTARTRYRALIKKRLMPVTVDGPLPEPGTPVTLGDRTVGEVRSGRGGRALALLRLEDVERAAQDQQPLEAAGTAVVPKLPDWSAN